jgi:hypothetical protein
LVGAVGIEHDPGTTKSRGLMALQPLCEKYTVETFEAHKYAARYVPGVLRSMARDYRTLFVNVHRNIGRVEEWPKDSEWNTPHNTKIRGINAVRIARQNASQE